MLKSDIQGQYTSHPLIMDVGPCSHLLGLQTCQKITIAFHDFAGPAKKILPLPLIIHGMLILKKPAAGLTLGSGWVAASAGAA